MSTSLLYHAFGLPTGYEHQPTFFEGGVIRFVVEEKRERPRCSICSSRDVIQRGSQLRQFRTLPIGKREVWIQFAVPRLECKACQCIRQAKVCFADGLSSGPMEGANNKIKTIHKTAYGFRDLGFMIEIARKFIHEV